MDSCLSACSCDAAKLLGKAAELQVFPEMPCDGRWAAALGLVGDVRPVKSVRAGGDGVGIKEL